MDIIKALRMYLYGASGHGKVVKDILEANGTKVVAFLDDNPEVAECGGLPVLHEPNGKSPVIVSIGAGRARKMIVEKLRKVSPGIVFGTAVHPSAVVSPSARLGEGTVVMPGAVINADAVVGKHCIVNTGATVDHDCVLGDYCHVAPGAHVCGMTCIGEGTWVGVGSSLIQCLHIGRDCIIGAGSVVLCDLPDGATAYGCPAKVHEIAVLTK